MGIIGGEKVEGNLFYFLGWIFWIITTFFLNKENKNRFRYSLGLLLIIFLSIHTFYFLGIEISFAFIILLLCTYLHAAKLNNRNVFYVIISSFIITLAFVSFQLFEIFDPVWVIFNRNIMLVTLIIVLASILENNRRIRIVTILIGSIHGELLYAYVINKYDFYYTVGSLVFFDFTSLAMAIVLSWYGLVTVVSYLEKQVFHFEREKQKQS